MKTLRTQIDIDATAERVWDTLTNIADYSTWNQFIPHLEGLRQASAWRSGSSHQAAQQ
jgi:uncharacterized protein YndB with AHSA1/START domain